MTRMHTYALAGFCSMTLMISSALAAEPTNPAAATPAQDEAKMPATAEFSNGPQGGGAQLLGTDHVPSAAEFSDGPVGGAAAADPSPRHLPTAGEFSNGPTDIGK